MNGTTDIRNSVRRYLFPCRNFWERGLIFNDRKVGKLKDVIALDQGKVAEVTHFLIAARSAKRLYWSRFRKCDRLALARSSLTTAIPALYARELVQEVPS